MIGTDIMDPIIDTTTDTTTETASSKEQDVERVASATPASEQQQIESATNDQPAAETKEEAERPAEDVGAAYSLEVPGDLPPRATSDADLAVLADAATAAHEAGVPQAIAQLAVETFVDHVASMGAIDASHYDAHDAARYLRAEWRDGFESKLQRVHRTVARLGPKFADFLKRTNLGNDPRMIAMLADVDDLKRSKSDAQAELDKLKDSKSDYFSPEAWKRQPAVARMKALGRIVHRGERSDDDVFRENVQKKVQTQLSAASGSVAVVSTARKELNAMLADRGSALNNLNHPDHAAAVKRFQVLAAKIRG